MYIYLSISLSICVYLSICQSVYLSTCLSLYLSIISITCYGPIQRFRKSSPKKDKFVRQTCAIQYHVQLGLQDKGWIYILAWPLAGNTRSLHCFSIGLMILHCVPIGPMILHSVPIGLPEISCRIYILAWPLAGNTGSLHCFPIGPIILH